MRTIALLDTSISSVNLGDEIIMDAVRLELRECLPDAYIYTAVTHDYLGRMARKILRQCEFCVVGGTNALSSKMTRGANWRVTPLDIGSLHNVVTMGVGWQDYQASASRYAKLLYSQILSRDHLHSVRDGYSLGRINELRVESVNTGCPTMWRLDPAHCAAIPTHKADCAVASLTFYRPDPDNDRKTMDLICGSYGKVYFWSQQREDWDYVNSLGHFDLELVNPSVGAYTELLNTQEIDFIGSRLHGGIRALQRGRRALIITVDNRATEIGRDTNCATVARDAHDQIRRWIGGSDPVRINLPTAAIARWRSQFASS